MDLADAAPAATDAARTTKRMVGMGMAAVKRRSVRRRGVCRGN